MGQYYLPITSSAEKREDFAQRITAWGYSHDFGNGLKLMEHSWLQNGFVFAITSMLRDNPLRVVWAGDYADEDVPTGKPGEQTNLHFWTEKGENKGRKIVPDPDAVVTPFTFLLNHDRREYVSLTDLPVENPIDPDPWYIHPLPLLTAEGNGRGGGDYYGDGMEFVGRWARDLISTSRAVSPPDGWKQIKPDFHEDR